MGLNFNDMINTQLIYRFELAQVVAKRINKPQRIIFRFESHWLLFFYSFFFFFFFLRFAGGSMVARYCVLAGNSIYLKNMVYHVAAFFVPIAMFCLRIETRRLCHVDIIRLGKIKLRCSAPENMQLKT